MRRPHSSRPGAVARLGPALALGLVLGLALTGCTDASEPGPGADRGGDQGGVSVPTRVTRVAGDLAGERRAQVGSAARSLVEDYVEAAYVRGRAGRDAFPGFTEGAQRLAVRDRRVLTGVGLSAPVAVRRARAYVNVWAHRGRAVGATVRVDVTLRAEGDRLSRLRGRLLITPTENGWRVFGYDLARSGLGARGKDR